MSVGQDAALGPPVGIAGRVRLLRVRRPRVFGAAVAGVILLVVLIVVAGAYAIGSAHRAAQVDGQLLALNSQGENVTQLQNQTVGAYDTDVKVVRQASAGWTDTLLTSLAPLTDASTVAGLRADVTALLADAQPIAADSWKSLSSPGADISAVDAGRAQLERATAADRAATAAATRLGRAQSALLAQLKQLATSMRNAQPGLLAANASAAPSVQQAFITAEQSAISEMTEANAQAAVAAYGVLVGGSNATSGAPVAQAGAGTSAGTSPAVTPTSAAAPPADGH